MADYISREDAINTQKRRCLGCPVDRRLCYKCAVATTTKQLLELPSADVRPVVRGEWEHISFMTCRCSVCKEVFHELEGDNFCPNCGADMRPEEAPVHEQPKEKKPKNVIHLWMDGYVCNGDSAGPSRCGVYEAETLRDAVIMWANEKPERWKDINIYRNPPEFWGCSFFDKKR